MRVLNEAECRRLQMGSFLSVTDGTEEPAYLIVLEYNGGRARRGADGAGRQGRDVRHRRHFAQAAAGDGRDEVRHERRRQRARHVQGRRELELPINLVGVVPACENMPSGRATKPGDIVKSMSGQTIEVLNTDAEGRLILCDAITYARRFKPDVVIDIATLTGACVVALGNHLSGLFSNDDELAAALEEAGRRADDRAWHMPIGEEYGEQLEEQLRRLRQRRRPRRRRDHRGLLPGEVHRRPEVGAPRHRRHGLSGRRAQGQHRPARAAAGRLPA